MGSFNKVVKIFILGIFDHLWRSHNDGLRIGRRRIGWRFIFRQSHIFGIRTPGASVLAKHCSYAVADSAVKLGDFLNRNDHVCHGIHVSMHASKFSFNDKSNMQEL